MNHTEHISAQCRGLLSFFKGRKIGSWYHSVSVWACPAIQTFEPVDRFLRNMVCTICHWSLPKRRSFHVVFLNNDGRAVLWTGRRRTWALCSGNYKRIFSLWYSENLYRQFSSFSENKQCTIAVMLLGYGKKNRWVQVYVLCCFFIFKYRRQDGFLVGDGFVVSNNIKHVSHVLEETELTTSKQIKLTKHKLILTKVCTVEKRGGEFQWRILLRTLFSIIVVTTKCRKLVLLLGVSTVVKHLSLHILDTEHFGVVIISFILCSGGLPFVFQLKTICAVFMWHFRFSKRRCWRSKCDWCSYRHFEEPFWLQFQCQTVQQE